MALFELPKKLKDTIGNIPSMAGNLWKGGPATLYFDMFNNGSSYDQAASKEISNLAPEDYEWDNYDDEDEYLFEKAAYQLDKPDVLMTPFGPSLSNDVVDALSTEYPAITALAELPVELDDVDDMTDYYMGWDDYFDEADSLLEAMPDEIDGLAKAVQKKVAEEGGIGTDIETAALVSIGENLGNAFKNLSTAAQEGITKAFDKFVTPVHADEKKTIDRYKDITTKMTELWSDREDPDREAEEDKIFFGAPDPLGLDDDMGTTPISDLGVIEPEVIEPIVTDTGVTEPIVTEPIITEPIVTDTDEPSLTAEELMKEYQDAKAQIAQDKVDTITTEGQSMDVDLTGASTSDESSLTAGDLMKEYQSAGKEIVSQQMASELDTLLIPDPSTGYGATLNEILEELKINAVPPATVTAWMNSTEFDSGVKALGGNTDQWKQSMAKEMQISGIMGTDTAATTKVDPTKAPLDVAEDKDKSSSPYPVKHPTEGIIPPAGALSIPAARASADDEYTARLKSMGENLNETFWKTVYAQPGTGRADVEQELRYLRGQTQTMFFLAQGLNAWSAFNPETISTEHDKAASDLQNNYEAFLGSWMENPERYRSSPWMRQRIGRVSHILNKFRLNPNIETWEPDDRLDHVWINGLFGGDDYTARQNRNNLIMTGLTQGGRGYYSQRIHSSASRLMEYYERIGKSPSEIFSLMTNTPYTGTVTPMPATSEFIPETPEDLRLENQPMNVGGDYGISAITGADPADMGSSIWNFAAPTQPPPRVGGMATQPFVPDFVPETPEDLMVLDQLMDVGGASTQPFVPERPAFVPETLDDLRIEDQPMDVGGVDLPSAIARPKTGSRFMDFDIMNIPQGFDKSWLNWDPDLIRRNHPGLLPPDPRRLERIRELGLLEGQGGPQDVHLPYWRATQLPPEYIVNLFNEPMGRLSFGEDRMIEPYWRETGGGVRTQLMPSYWNRSEDELIRRAALGSEDYINY